MPTQIAQRNVRQKMFWLFIRDSMWAAWFGGIVCAYDSMVHQVTHTTQFYFDTDINIQQSIHSPSGWSLRHLLKILLIQSLLNHCISSLFSFKSPEIQAKLCDGIFEEQILEIRNTIQWLTILINTVHSECNTNCTLKQHQWNVSLKPLIFFSTLSR